jgi:hypothetical protein
MLMLEVVAVVGGGVANPVRKLDANRLIVVGYVVERVA